MSNPHLVTSRDNPVFKDMLKELKASASRRTRTLLVGTKLIEAWWEARRTEAGARLQPLSWVRLEDSAPHPLEEGLPVLLLPETRMKGLTDSATPPEHALYMEVGPDPAGPLGKRAILPWGIQDPGNLGAILRAGAAFGFEDAVLGPGCADPFSPKALRGAMGAAFQIRIRRAERVPLDEGRWYALDGGPGAMPLETADLGAPLRLMVGNEGHGWRDAGLPPQVQRLAIPIGAVESLNAAVAAGIACYEADRRSARN